VKSGALGKLVRMSIGRDRRGAASSVFGVAIGIASLVFFVALGMGISRVVREKVFPVEAQLIEVVPPQVTLGGLLGGKIDQTAVDRLRALPGVKSAYRKMNLRVPAVSRYNGDFFGAKLYMGIEVLAVGVDTELVKADVQLGDFSDPPKAGDPIPAIAATRLLEIYNKTFAPARSLPQLSPTMVVGFGFPIEIGRSFVTQTTTGTVSQGAMQLVGVSDRGLLAGLTIPLASAVRLNKAAGLDSETFTAVTLQANDASAVPGLVAAIKEMGFRVDDQERRMAENAGAAVTVTTFAMALLSALICFLAAINIAHALSASVRARAKELGVMRAVGASKSDVRALVLAEAAALGLVGGIAGTAVAVLAAMAIDLAAARLLPQFPFKPDTFFQLPWLLVAGGIALGVLSSLAGAWLPSRHAASIDPARTLAG
jgi:putative ABC transport system permease protein